jgi:hypothetical protein
MSRRIDSPHVLAVQKPTSSRRLRVLVPLAVVAVLATAGTAQAAERRAPAGAPADGITRALLSGELTRAEYALERALALVRPERARRLFGEVAPVDPRGGTPIFRELAARTSELPPAQRRLAQRLLARPTSPSDPFVRYGSRAFKTCNPRMCFWWVQKTRDAPTLLDTNRNGLPDWIDKTRTAFDKVWATEVGAFNYRRPRSDLSSRYHGPNRKLDVYIADLGALGLYGYCTTDDPRRSSRRYVSAYCVVDDDFSRKQFQVGAYGVAALRVTAAHEFFHAVQFAYDWKEDLWLMEGSAAWIEDEVYDGINDNRQYLDFSPIGQSTFWHALDWYHPNPANVLSLQKYGAWIFFRYLSERYTREIVRTIWRRADAIPGTPNDYSMKAAVNAVALQGDDLHDVFADFGAANIYPDTSYSEGSAYPTPQPTISLALGTGNSPLSSGSIPMDHMSNDYYRFRPATGTLTTLTFAISLPAPVTNPRARALVEAMDGTVTTVPAVLNGVTGQWDIVVNGFGAVKHVTLVLTNASTRYSCRQGTVLSCRGIPLDDLNYSFVANAG